MSEIESIIQKIEQEGILTGSRALGVQTESSDWDYIVLLSIYDIIREKLTIIGYKYEDKNDYGTTDDPEMGLYFTYNDRIYNIIGLSKIKFRCWKHTLLIMQNLPEVFKLNFVKKTKRKTFYHECVYALERLIKD